MVQKFEKDVPVLFIHFLTIELKLTRVFFADYLTDLHRSEYVNTTLVITATIAIATFVVPVDVSGSLCSFSSSFVAPKKFVQITIYMVAKTYIKII